MIFNIWEDMIDINIKGVLYGIVVVLFIFWNQGLGYFINIVFMVVYCILFNMFIYVGIKFVVCVIFEGLC